MRIVTTILVLLIIILGLTFAGLNASPVEIHYYIGTASISLSLLLVLTLGLGAVLGLLANVIPIIKLKRHNRRFKKRIKDAEQEIANLRSIPIKDSH